MARDFGHEDAGNASPESLERVVRTPGVTTFLTTNRKRYVVGPKGSGKTLILLRKAIDERFNGSAICIPNDASRPVDRLDAAEHLGQRFFRKIGGDAKRDQHLSWTAVWKHSILRSVLHHLHAGVCEQLTDPIHERKVKALIRTDSPVPLRPFHYYRELTNRLDSSPREVLAGVRDDLMDLDIFLQIFPRDVSVFLDNLDDYYEMQPELWRQSMYGQFRAVREISQAYRHLHLYTSIRQDVYSQFRDEMRLQYYDYVAELKYAHQDLLEIFESRIRDLDEDLLERPSARESDPWVAFFGEASLVPGTDGAAPEAIGHFLLRHTFGRPRDLIHQGTVLLEDRRSAFTVEQVRTSIARASEHILDQYLAEVEPLLAPHAFDLPEFLTECVTEHVMTREQVRECTDLYLDWKGLNAEAGPVARPFAILYDLGLLGVAKATNGAGGATQSFRSPGQGLDDVMLPPSPAYFLHPIVGHQLERSLPTAPLPIGDGLPAERR